VDAKPPGLHGPTTHSIDRHSRRMPGLSRALWGLSINSAWGSSCLETFGCYRFL
jgi:hypothetical protein